MAEKLSGITTQYHMFVDNQVLTKDQLNGFIDYFEDQHRLSRVFLHGVGTVCGFKLHHNSPEGTVTLSRGVGVTTDGDLILLRKDIAGSSEKSIDLKEIQFTHFRKFGDNFANYPFFRKKEDGGETETIMDLWEILPEQTEGEKPLGEMPDVGNKVVVLYLESYAREGDLCTSIDCDNQGIEQVARLRVLLISKEDATYMVKRDTLFSKYERIDEYFDLPEVAVPRVILNPNNTSSYENLKLAFHKAINNKVFFSNLSVGITKILKDFDTILQMKLPKNSLASLLAKLNEIAGTGSFNIPFNVQYRYDFFKDVTDIYLEIKAHILSLREECCPDTHAFPKHLLLGSLDETESSVKHFRHGFYKSPSLSCGSGKLEECRSLVLRLIEIISRFGEKTGEIKITPSKKMGTPGERAIPFYYTVDHSLLEYWNYDKTKKNSPDTNLGYHRERLAKLPHIQDPLSYNIDGFDFYRIEGHQGKDYKTALDEINDQKERYGLAFDVKALSISLNTESLNINQYECEFEDLKVLLNAWTAEQECILAQVSSFFSGFSLVKPGANVKDPVLTHRTKKNAFAVNKAAFPRMTTIADSFTTEKDALGSILVKAYEETRGGSVNDVIAKSRTMVESQLSDETWREQPEMKTFVIDQSIELLAWSNELVTKMPVSIRDFTISQVDTYKLTLEELCKRVKLMKNRYQQIELSQSMKLFMDLLINQLSHVCCSGKKIEILFEEIDNRKERILLRLQLTRFIEKHPGLEHKAGVQPGGTFVLVYLNKIQTKPIRTINPERHDIADNLAVAGIKSSSFEETEKRLSLFGRYTEYLKKENPDDEEILRIETLMKEERSRLSGRVPAYANIPDNTVVADFSLPYLCCSDCAPVNFIIQKPPARLRLEKDSWCLGDEPGVILYDVSPPDGVIATAPTTEGLTIGEGKITIDPATFPADRFGQTLHFTVNQQVTDALLTVHKAPQAAFEAPEKAPVGQEIIFKPSGDTGGASFLWYFGDGSTSAEESPTHTYKALPGTNDNIVVVKLTVTGPNGVCTATAEHKIQLFETEEPPIGTCMESAKESMRVDLKNLQTLQFPGSNFVVPVWVSTSELYGGTANFGKGVLDDADNFLTGNHNDRLEEMFSHLWEETSKWIMELSGNPDSEEFQHLVQIFSLQIRLFYNLTGCQRNDVLDVSGEMLKRLLEQIIAILKNLRERDIKLPESFRPFLEEWAKRVSGKGILEEHVKSILNDNLV